MSESKSEFNYIEMRKLVLQDKLATVEELAVMPDDDVLALVMDNYRYLGDDGEAIILVHKDRYREVLNTCKRIPWIKHKKQ